jgi:hypothetical protein
MRKLRLRKVSCFGRNVMGNIFTAYIQATYVCLPVLSWETLPEIFWEKLSLFSSQLEAFLCSLISHVCSFSVSQNNSLFASNPQRVKEMWEGINFGYKSPLLHTHTWYYVNCFSPKYICQCSNLQCLRMQTVVGGRAFKEAFQLKSECTATL